LIVAQLVKMRLYLRNLKLYYHAQRDPDLSQFTIQSLLYPIS